MMTEETSWLRNALADVAAMDGTCKEKWQVRQQVISADRQAVSRRQAGGRHIEGLAELLRTASDAAGCKFTKAHKLQAALAAAGQKEMAKRLKVLAEVALQMRTSTLVWRAISALLLPLAMGRSPHVTTTV